MLLSCQYLTDLVVNIVPCYAYSDANEHDFSPLNMPKASCSVVGSIDLAVCTILTQAVRVAGSGTGLYPTRGALLTATV